MSPVDVRAVIYSSGPVAPEVRAAAGAQAELVPAAVATLAEAVRGARSLEARWLWLLDGWAVPEPDALEALLAAAGVAGQPAPALLASKVIDGDGHLHPDATPQHEVYATERSVAAALRHLVQLRAAAPGSVLVDRLTADRVRQPRSDLPAGLDMREWSARVLRSPECVGYLVPGSVAVRTASPDPIARRDLVARARVAAGGAWTPREKLREAYRLVRDAPAWARPASARRTDREGPPGSPTARSG